MGGEEGMKIEALKDNKSTKSFIHGMLENRLYNKIDRETSDWPMETIARIESNEIYILQEESGEKPDSLHLIKEEPLEADSDSAWSMNTIEQAPNNEEIVPEENCNQRMMK